MNYLREINALYDSLETNSLSEHAIVLWHALMHINNKAGWQKEFTVAVSVLELKTGLKRKSIERARNELSQKGRITWKSRAGNQSAIYRLVSLADQQDVAQVGVQIVVQSGAQPVAINKLNKTKQYNSAPKRTFKNFDERAYNTDALERLLLERSKHELQ